MQSNIREQGRSLRMRAKCSFRFHVLESEAGKNKVTDPHISTIPSSKDGCASRRADQKAPLPDIHGQIYGISIVVVSTPIEARIVSSIARDLQDSYFCTAKFALFAKFRETC